MMPRRLLFAGSLLPLLAAAALALVACSEGFAEKSCGEIPAGGCPARTGGTCEDPVCEAIYSCVDELWRLDSRCASGAGGGGAGAGGEVGAGGTGGAGGGAGGCEPVMIDKTGQAQGCTPMLQPPDCGVAAAEMCQPCATGCLDFFLCKENGWEAVAFCDGDGKINLGP